MTERERAERIVRTLRPTDPGSWELSTVYVRDELSAFAREERARVWEEAEEMIETHRGKYGDVPVRNVKQLLRCCLERAQALREEGGQR